MQHQITLENVGWRLLIEHTTERYTELVLVDDYGVLERDTSTKMFIQGADDRGVLRQC